MNEKRMKTSVNTGELSLPPAHGACWGVKARAKYGCCSEKPAFDVEKLLEMPKVERTTTKTPEKLNLNHEHQLKWETSVYGGGSKDGVLASKNLDKP